MYLSMVSFVSFRRTYCGRILSVPLRYSSSMDVDFANIKIHANSFRRGLGRFIRVGKTKYMQTGPVVVLVMSYSRAKQSTFSLLLTILVVPDVMEDVGCVVLLILYILECGHHVRIIVSGLAIRC